MIRDSWGEEGVIGKTVGFRYGAMSGMGISEGLWGL